ncbi:MULTISPECIES: hypothetical protein [Yimella]|uniref:hypothetical protein n=1 Tax=Yimella TaxID=908935 RepID=UPI001459FC84|nr:MULTISPECIES: hypothetical protein [Yimella]
MLRSLAPTTDNLLRKSAARLADSSFIGRPGRITRGMKGRTDRPARTTSPTA